MIEFKGTDDYGIPPFLRHHIAMQFRINWAILAGYVRARLHYKDFIWVNDRMISVIDDFQDAKLSAKVFERQIERLHRIMSSMRAKITPQPPTSIQEQGAKNVEIIINSKEHTDE